MKSWTTRYPHLQPLRLHYELEAVKAKFPNSRLTAKSDGSLELQIWIRSRSGQAYLIGLRPPANYPHAQPALFPLNPKIKAPLNPFTQLVQHFYPNGSMCVYVKSWNPARSTLLSVVPIAEAWINAHEHFQRTGAWDYAAQPPT